MRVVCITALWAGSLPPRGRAGGEVDYYYEKRNLENGDSTGDISSHRSGYFAWCYKLHVIAQSKRPYPSSPREGRSRKTLPSLPSRGKESKDPSQPSLQREGVVNRQIPPANISPLMRGGRRGLKKMLKHERLKSLCFYLSKVFCEQAPSDI